MNPQIQWSEDYEVARMNAKQEHMLEVQMYYSHKNLKEIQKMMHWFTEMIKDLKK